MNNIFTDSYESTPTFNPEFIEASEAFGGALELRAPNSFGIKLEKELEAGLNHTRLYAIRPLNIINSVIHELNQLSPKLAEHNSTLQIGYITNKLPNAYCWKKDNLTFIGATSGLVFFIAGTISHLLSFPEFLTQNVFSEDEISGDFTKLREHVDLKKLFDRKKETGLLYGQYRTPVNDLRKVAALQITHMALVFTFLHEIGHYYYGHIDFILDKLKLKSLVEIFGDSTVDDESYNLFQRFELLADDFAIEFMANKVINGDFFANNLEQYFLWSISVDFLLWMFGQKSSLNIQASTHPHPYVRILSKFLKIAKLKILCSEVHKVNNANKKDLSVNDICHLATLDLMNSWKTMRLPGIECFFSKENIHPDADGILESVQRKDSTLWLAYENYVNISIIEQAKRVNLS